MAIGQRKHQVVIKAPPTGQDSTGSPSGSWTTVATVWADIRYQRGLESIRAGAEGSTTTASMNIAYRADITTAMRVELGGVLYGIKAVLPDLLHKRHVDLVCAVVV